MVANHFYDILYSISYRYMHLDTLQFDYLPMICRKRLYHIVIAASAGRQVCLPRNFHIQVFFHN